MIAYHHGLPGGAATIHCLEPGDDATPVLDFIAANPILAVDTETTGLPLGHRFPGAADPDR